MLKIPPLQLGLPLPYVGHAAHNFMGRMPILDKGI